MIKTVPETTAVRCDFCGHEVLAQVGDLKTRSRYKKSAAVVLKQDALDTLGDPVADGTVRYDACDTCMSKVRRVVDDMLLGDVREVSE